ncbi:MAG TPA: GFA family protein [Hyphomicrobium sp.]|jgi:hypothetical protein
MTEEKTYEGGCHCGNVRYRVRTDFARVMTCNCSRCAKLGALFSFVTPSQFDLVSGMDALTDYQFNKKAIHHLFCCACGVESFARGTAPNGDELVAINVRCLDGIDLDALTLTPVDGKSF